MKLWYVPSHRSSETAEYVVVTKIGRKWATVGEGWAAMRISLDTWTADGGQYLSPGSCYESLQAYEDERRLCDRWREVRSYIEHSYRVPEGFTMETVEALAAQFGMPKADRKP